MSTEMNKKKRKAISHKNVMSKDQQDMKADLLVYCVLLTIKKLQKMLAVFTWRFMWDLRNKVGIKEVEG